MLKTIYKYLDAHGFKHAQLGFDYIISAIEIGLKDKMKITKAITKEIYPDVAKLHGTTPSRVERAIRHCISTCTSPTVFALTNSEFLAKAVDDIKYGGLTDETN
jgi:two-component system response regulator (stage 0 sporulation protein A)